MTFQQLTFIVEVAKCESINKAAEQLYTSQSNVSSSIKTLEDELGIQIFNRTKKGISVTEDGRELLSYAEEILQKKSFVEDLYKKRGFRKQYFSVSSMRSYFLSVPIARLCPRIMEGRDEPLYIRLKKEFFDDVLDDVQLYRSDLGIVFLTESHKSRIRKVCSIKNLEYTQLGKSHISLVMRRDHPVFSEPDHETQTRRITDYPYAVCESKESFGRFYDDTSRSIYQLFQTQPKCIISINDSAASQDLVAATDAFFISSTKWKHSDHYPFSSVPLAGDDNVLVYYYVTRKGQERHYLTDLYIEELKKMFEDGDL